MNTHFVNLNPDVRSLPATLTVPWDGDLYRARVLHAETDHFAPPVRRRPALFLHDHYHIVLVTDNQGNFNLDGRDIPAATGDVFFTSPLIRHNFSNVSPGRARYAEVTFEWVNAQGTPLRIPFHRLLEAWTNQPCAEATCVRAQNVLFRSLRAEIAALVSRGRVGGARDIELNRHLASLLQLAFDHVFSAAENRRTDRLDAVREYLHTHYREPLTLSALAARAGVTPNYLSRRFKQLYHRTPIDLQLDLRIRDACTRLRTSDHKLERVARAVGFDDVFYFSRLFRKRVGVSPTHYRQRLLVKHADPEN